ncbi:MAG TPA: type III pantothenate kinase [Verrucomicrobiae bacterium]|jgi:type III pantothenate kinase|nr:type III pantothenate kinase [Verrucomicrobiae bacterium]
MLLTIDIGNTETKLGLFAPGDELPTHRWRVTTEPRRTPDEYGAFITQLFGVAGISLRDVTAAAVASVVPHLDAIVEEACVHFLGVTPVFLKAHRQQLMEVRTDRPAEVGADLVAVAIGARARYGAPLIVISYGTATVFMAISAGGAYEGVAIAPGINISIEALAGRTAKLPQIALEHPGHAIARTTIEALQAGIVYGFVGQTEALVARFRAEMGCDAKVVATGGLADVIAKHTKIIAAVDPHLSLIGLRLFHVREIATNR